MEGTPQMVAKGLIEKIGLPDSRINHKVTGNGELTEITPIPDHQTGIDLLLKKLLTGEMAVLSTLSEIQAVGHRVAHGGEKFKSSALITPDVEKGIEECCELAPLHNPANLKGIRAMQKLLPNVPQVAVFDTSFHHTLPDHAYIYGIPYYYYEKYKIRKYGFHGTSHKYVAETGAAALGLDWKALKIITCHLGNGASITAIDKGVSIETSMGFTPVEGLVMGTRCGDLDLGVILYLMEKENMCCSELNDLVNKKSGMLGITGVSSDMRDIAKAADEGNYRADLGLRIYANMVRKYIGAYTAVLNGLDLLIFTGGIGENDVKTRERVLHNMDNLGIVPDLERNLEVRGETAIISSPASKVRVMVVPTNEELVIARDTFQIISNR
ncbi:MAG: acetate kinase [Bacteroidales bacterium]|nr:acetate kinase [Bacteroidales bacterium]MDN5330182.1 acetate kinase [Bacteroidales bacterium]